MKEEVAQPVDAQALWNPTARSDHDRLVDGEIPPV